LSHKLEIPVTERIGHLGVCTSVVIKAIQKVES